MKTAKERGYISVTIKGKAAAIVIQRAKKEERSLAWVIEQIILSNTKKNP